MYYKYVTRLFCFTLFIYAAAIVKAQCPPNIDFSLGTFENWECRTGSVYTSGGVNDVDWTGFTQAENRHLILDATNASFDVYGNFPQLCPNGNKYSVKLGNGLGGGQAESISYTYEIPSSLTQFSITYQYAVVLQNPDHQFDEQPRFRANIINVTDNVLIDCVTFDYTASLSLPGFSISPRDPDVLYKDWTSVTIDLSTFAGKTVKLEFITSDCVFTAHFGYAYININSSCGSAIIGSTVCESEKKATLTAPHGYPSYKWYSDDTFSQLLSASQFLNIEPLPPTGTVYPVIVTPYAGYGGCKDTLYAKLIVVPTPKSTAGIDISICKNQQVQIGGITQTGNSYAWTPLKYVSDSAISNPLTKNIVAGSQQLIVKTTSPFSKCFSQDTIIVAVKPVDRSIKLNGMDKYCIGDPIAASLSVNNVVNSVQWYRNSTPIAGATSFTYLVSDTGSYWARVSQNGCTDSTAIIPVNIYLDCNYVPTGFTPNGDGLNDELTPIIFHSASFKSFSVYNRWGIRVFHSTENGKGWNGRYQGQLMDAGVYVWMLQLTDTNGKIKLQKGTVTIIR